MASLAEYIFDHDDRTIILDNNSEQISFENLTKSVNLKSEKFDTTQ